MIGISMFSLGKTQAEKVSFENEESMFINQTFSLFFDSSSQLSDFISYNSLYNHLNQSCKPSLNQKKNDTIKLFVEKLSEEELQSLFSEMKTKILQQNLSCEQAFLYAKTVELMQDKVHKSHDIQEMDEQIIKAEQQLQEKQIITIKNHNTNLKKSSFKLASIYAEMVIQESLQSLYEKHYLNQQDLETLSGKIELFYYLQYGINEGKFYAKTDKKTDEVLLKGISFKFNLYSMKSFIADLQADIQRILMHELGHYFYYFQPDVARDFKKICWKEVSCIRDDFVSKYAKESLEEDFAETFAYQFFA